MAVRVSVDVCSVHRNRLTARFPHSGSKAQWSRTLVSHLYSLQRAPTSDKRLVRRNYLSRRMRPHAFSRRFPVDRWPRIASAANGLRRLHHESASQASELKQGRQKETVHRAAFFRCCCCLRVTSTGNTLAVRLMSVVMAACYRLREYDGSDQ